MRGIRTLAALLLTAALLAGTVPARAVEPEDLPAEALTETLPDSSTETPEEESTETLPEDPDESLTETPAEDPDGSPAEEGSPETGEPVGGGDVSGGDGGDLWAEVSTSAEFRDALKDPRVKDISFKGHITVEASDGENDLEALDKVIRPVDGDYQNNSLDFDPGVTLLQISPHEGNQAQNVADQSISLIYGTVDNGSGGKAPDLGRLTELVPGTLGWYEYHDANNAGDEYAGKRVCYTMYFGTAEDAIAKAAELTAGHWFHKATGSGDDNRLVFTIFGSTVNLDRSIETDMFYALRGSGLTVGGGVRLRVRDYLEVEGTAAVWESGTLDLSDWAGTTTGDGFDGKPYLNISYGDLAVNPGGTISLGSLGGRVDGSVFLGRGVSRPANLEYRGEFFPCLTAKLGEDPNYSTALSMLPGGALDVTFALCEYLGGGPWSLDYTDLTEAEVTSSSFILPSFLQYAQNTEGVWTLTAAENASMGDSGEIIYTSSTAETYTLPVRIEQPELSGLPELGCYFEPEVSQKTFLKDWWLDPLTGASTFYVCVRKDTGLLDSWDITGLTCKAVRFDQQDQPVEVPGGVQCTPVPNETGVWQVTVTHPFRVDFELALTSKDATQTRTIETDIWVESPERLFYSDAPLDGEIPDSNQNNPDRVLSDANRGQLHDKLQLTANASRDVVLYQLVYDQKDTLEASRWVLEYVPWDWAKGLDGIHLSRVSGAGKELYTRVTAERNAGEAAISRLYGDENGNPDLGHHRGEPLPVAIDPAASDGPQLVVQWGGGDYGEDITMTPRDRYEVTFWLRTYTGEGTDGPVYSYEAASGDALDVPTPLRYENQPEEQDDGVSRDHWILTAEGAELGQRYSITYTANGTTYTLPVRIELPDLGCYSRPEVNLEYYLTEWQYTPVGGDKFYVCVNPSAWFWGNSNWAIPADLEVSVRRNGKELSASGLVSCGSYSGAADTWEVTVFDSQMDVEFRMPLTWTGDVDQKPDDTDMPVPGTGLWIDTGEQLVYSTDILTGTSPYKDSRETLDLVLTDTVKGQLSTDLPLEPGTSTDVVLYLLRYDDGNGPDIGAAGWICEQVSGDVLQGRDGVLLSQVTDAGREACTRVTLLTDYRQPHIVRLGDRWVVDDEQNPDKGHWEPDYERTRGTPLFIQVTGGNGPFLMAVFYDEDGTPHYDNIIRMTPYDQYELSFALCVPGENGGWVQQGDPISFSSLPHPLQWNEWPDENGKPRGLLIAENTEWGQTYPITYTDAGRTYTLPVLITLPELGFYAKPQADPGCYLQELDFDPLAGSGEFYVCVSPDAGFLGDPDWRLPQDLTVTAWRYSKTDSSGTETKTEAPGAVSCVPVDPDAGIWRITAKEAGISLEVQLKLVWNGDLEKAPDDADTPVIGLERHVRAAERLVWSDGVLSGTSPYTDDPNSLDRPLTSANKSALHEALSLEVNTTKDVVLYLLVYNWDQDRWICEYTSAEWAEGRDGVSLTEVENSPAVRVTASRVGLGTVARLEGQCDNEGRCWPEPGSTRGIPLDVTVTGSPDDPRLTAQWPGGDYAEEIFMTPMDQCEVSFLLCAPGETGLAEVKALSQDDLQIPSALGVRVRTETDTTGKTRTWWTLTAENVEWGRTYWLTCAAGGKTYTLPVRITMPDLGCYRDPGASTEGYLRDWGFDPLTGNNTFYVCVDPDSELMNDPNWSLTENLTVTAWRDGSDADMSGYVTTRNIDNGVWEVTVTKPEIHVEFRMQPTDASSTNEGPGTGLWIDAPERLACSYGVLEGSTPDTSDPNSPDRVLSDTNRGSLSKGLSLTPGVSEDVVLYLLRYEQGADRWICEHTHRDWAEGRDGVILSVVPEEGKDAFTRVTLRANCGERPHIARLEGMWVPDESETGGGHHEPDHGSTRGIPLDVWPNRDPSAAFLMVDWGGGNYDDIIEMTPFDQRQVTFALCRFDSDQNKYVLEKSIPAGDTSLEIPGELTYTEVDGRWTLWAREDLDRNAMWGQTYPITYTEGTQAYTLSVLMSLPQMGCYWSPQISPNDYLTSWQFTPLGGSDAFYLCVDPNAWFMGEKDWTLPDAPTVRGVRYDKQGNPTVVEDSVRLEPALEEDSGKPILLTWKVTVRKPNISVEAEMKLVWAGDPSKKPSDANTPVIGTGLWVEAGQQLCWSDQPLAGSSPYADDSSSPDRLLTEANKTALENGCELNLTANTVRDLVLYLVTYHQDIEQWVCEHTSPEWAEGRCGVKVMETDREFFSRVTASPAQSGEEQPHIARLEHNENGRPIPGSIRGNPLKVHVDGTSSDAPRLMVRWSEVNFGEDLYMTPFDEQEVTFVLATTDASGTVTVEKTLSEEELDLGPLRFIERTETDTAGGTVTRRVLTAEEAEWNRTYSVTYTAEGRTYALPVRVDQPDLGCYSAPQPSRETLIRDLEFNPLADANEFYVCANPDAAFMMEGNGKWNVSDTLDVKAWRDNEENMDGCVKVEQIGKGVWRVTVAEAAVHAEFAMTLEWIGEGTSPDNNIRNTGLWTKPVERLVFSDAILKGAPLGNDEDLNQLLTAENRGLLRQTVTLNTGASRDLALYLLVYDYSRNLWTCEYADSSWYRTEDGAIQLTQLKDSPLFHVKALSQGTAKIVRLEGKKVSPDNYTPVPNTTRGVPLDVTVSGTTARQEMTAPDGKKVEVTRAGTDGRTLTISAGSGSTGSALSAAAPLFAAGYDAEGRLVSISAITKSGSVSFPKNVAWYRLIWADENSAPRCESVYEYLGVN